MDVCKFWCQPFALESILNSEEKEFQAHFSQVGRLEGWKVVLFHNNTLQTHKGRHSIGAADLVQTRGASELEVTARAPAPASRTAGKPHTSRSWESLSAREQRALETVQRV